MNCQTHELSSSIITSSRQAVRTKTHVAMIIANSQDPNTKLKRYQSNERNRRWSSSSSPYIKNDVDMIQSSSFINSSSCISDPSPTIIKQRRYTFSSLSSFTDSYDKPIRRPLRRLSIDSNTSSISSTSSSKINNRRNNKTKSNNIGSPDVGPIRLPMYISFQIFRNGNEEKMTTTMNHSNVSKKLMPPKIPKRITSMDDIKNNTNNDKCIDIQDVVVSNKNTSFSTETKPIIISTLLPICRRSNKNTNYHQRLYNMNDDKLQQNIEMISMIMSEDTFINGK